MCSAPQWLDRRVHHRFVLLALAHIGDDRLHRAARLANPRRVLRIAASSMSAISTFAPSAANFRAVAPPIPCAPPVTIATRPASRPIAPPLQYIPRESARRRIPRLPTAGARGAISHRRPGQHPAAVHEEGAAGAVGGFLRAEEDDHVTDIEWLPGAANWNLRFGPVQVVGVLLRPVVHRRQNHPRRDVVDRHAVCAQFQRQRPGQVAQPSLRRAVGRTARRAGFLMNGTDIDDAPALPPRDQPPRGLLGAEERAVQVGANHPLPGARTSSGRPARCRRCRRC